VLPAKRKLGRNFDSHFEGRSNSVRAPTCFFHRLRNGPHLPLSSVPEPLRDKSQERQAPSNFAPKSGF
jgi:hypothetical protein